MNREYLSKKKKKTLREGVTVAENSRFLTFDLVSSQYTKLCIIFLRGSLYLDSTGLWKWNLLRENNEVILCLFLQLIIGLLSYQGKFYLQSVLQWWFAMVKND